MPNYTIYCDASCDTEWNLCAWGCIIYSPKNKSQVHSGCYKNISNSTIGEFRAIIKAIGKTKGIEKAKLTIYSDNLGVVESIAILSVHKKPPKKAHGEYHQFSQYLKTMKIKVQYIPRDKNLAHNVAKAELIKQRNSLKAVQD